MNPKTGILTLFFVAASVFAVFLLTRLTDKATAEEKRMDKSRIASIERIRPAVVQIGYEAVISGSKVRGVAGTGFLVARGGFVITNNHVLRLAVEGLTRAGATSINLLVHLPFAKQVFEKKNVVFGPTFVRVEFDVVEVDAVHDIALLKSRRDPFKGEVRTGVWYAGKELPLKVSVAGLASVMPPEGTSVLISGYPLESPTLVTQNGLVASQRFEIVATTEVPGAPPGWPKMPEFGDVLLIDAVVNPGNSGGPVYLVESGLVVGICRGNLPSPIRFQD